MKETLCFVQLWQIRFNQPKGVRNYSNDGHIMLMQAGVLVFLNYLDLLYILHHAIYVTHVGYGFVLNYGTRHSHGLSSLFQLYCRFGVSLHFLTYLYNMI